MAYSEIMGNLTLHEVTWLLCTLLQHAKYSAAASYTAEETIKKGFKTNYT